VTNSLDPIVVWKPRHPQVTGAGLDPKNLVKQFAKSPIGKQLLLDNSNNYLLSKLEVAAPLVRLFAHLTDSVLYPAQPITFDNFKRLRGVRLNKAVALLDELSASSNSSLEFIWLNNELKIAHNSDITELERVGAKLFGRDKYGIRKFELNSSGVEQDEGFRPVFAVTALAIIDEQSAEDIAVVEAQASSRANATQLAKVLGATGLMHAQNPAELIEQYTQARAVVQKLTGHKRANWVTTGQISAALGMGALLAGPVFIEQFGFLIALLPVTIAGFSVLKTQAIDKFRSQLEEFFAERLSSMDLNEVADALNNKDEKLRRHVTALVEEYNSTVSYQLDRLLSK